MYSGNTLDSKGAASSGFTFRLSFPRKVIIGVILLVALVAFEIFNFDTTRYALESLLGETSFMGIHWAVILAIAFCAIDFAGLARLFAPEPSAAESRAAWYLMGAWLLGATMNAMMTWWAVNLTLLNHELGNEVLSRAQLLRFVPLFVAVLVWLTRILFIGAFSMAGEHLFDLGADSAARTQRKPQRQPKRAPQPARTSTPQPLAAAPVNPNRGTQGPPMPRATSRPVPLGMQAQGRQR